MNKTLLLLAGISFILGGIIGGAASQWIYSPSASKLTSPVVQVPTPPKRPLAKYSFDALRQTTFTPEPIELIEIIQEERDYTSWLFRFQTEQGWVSGQMNLPRNKKQAFVPSSGRGETGNRKQFPVVVMLRGYVDKEEYQTGVGTKNAAAVFARNGYLTLAPDFLGYGSSDPEPENEIQSRLIRPTTVLQLIASLPNITQADPNRIYLWGHSNGGQIALSVLETSGKSYPTTLWAPVSKPFPYSVLYYTEEADDRGKYLRKVIAEFEETYNADEFSITNYLDWIQAPIQIHQGTVDDSVPWKWSLDLTGELQKRGIDVALFQYPGTDHNFHPSWDSVVSRDLIFFKKHQE